MVSNAPEPESSEAKQERLERELQACCTLLETDPKNPDILFQKGFLLNQLGQYEDAIGILEMSIKLSPAVKKYLQLGLAYSQIRDFENSIATYNKALKLDSKNPELHNSKGFALFLMGETDKAISEYQRALKIDKNYTDAALNLGFALDEKGNHKEAIDVYDKIIAINSHDCCAYFNKGFSLSEMGDYRRAVTEFSKSIELRPDDACTHFNKGYAHYRCREYRKALDEFDIAIKLDNNYVDAHYFRAILLKWWGKDTEAIAEYTFVLQYWPTEYSIYLSRGMLYQKHSSYKKAFADYQKVLAKRKRLKISNYIKIAQCQYELKDYQGAFNLLKPLFANGTYAKINLQSEMLIVTKILGDALFAMGNTDEANKYYNFWLNTWDDLRDYELDDLEKKRFANEVDEISMRITFRQYHNYFSEYR